MERVDTMRVLTFCVCALLLLSIVTMLYLAQGLLLPVFIAVFLALVLQPIVRRLCRIGLNRIGAAAVTLLLVLALVGGATYRLSIPALDWLDRIPVIAQKLEYRFYELRNSLEAAEQASEQLQEMTGDGTSDTVVVAEDSLANRLVTRVGSFLTQAGITVGLLFFLLAFGQPTTERVVQAFEERSTRRRLREITREVEQRCAQYLRTVTVINIGVGLCTGLGMWTLGMPNATLWGMLACLLNYMPYLGPTMMMLILGAVGIVTFDVPLEMLAPVLVFGVITGIEGQFVTPAVVGRQMTLNPIAVFLTIVVWFWIWGVLGAIIAVPLLASTKIIADQLPVLSPLAAFLGRPDGRRHPTESDGETETA